MNQSETGNKFLLSIILILILINVGLHTINLSYPAKPVFDEAHFASYATHYATHTPFFDIHPPLGKILYSAILTLNDPARYQANPRFVEIKRNPKTDEIEIKTPVKEFGSFPYLSLRIMSAVFGILLGLSVYVFTKALTHKELPAILAMFLTIFDNALLLETRLILLNGVYLTFGFFALALFFKKKPAPLLAGLMWGFALSTKLIGVVFIGPVIALIVLTKGEARWTAIRRFLIFLATGFGVLALFLLVVNPSIIPVNQSFKLYQSLISDFKPAASLNFGGTLSFLNPIAPYIKLSAIEFYIMLSGYTGGVPTHPFQSHWYTWPFMTKTMPYFRESPGATQSISLVGNPVIWALSLFSVLAVLAYNKRYLLQNAQHRNFWLLIIGYFSSLLPFALIERPAFLYHYFPALIFSICIASLFIQNELMLSISSKKSMIMTLLIATIIIAFLLVAPLTYGWPQFLFN
ncbi:phospholipid carrier-dependent glycosyltransferase [Candidatus Jorgensenbacteria bacterium]|nr:phospholipid carrier-dependent glycosyltransferase [Candidatus Jorgensenbacteria bacterium]